MSDDNLLQPKAADNFSTESPVRAFTDWREQGHYAIGKGFRPSLAHLHRYLDALHAKTGWGLIQILQGDSVDPTLIFLKVHVDPVMPELRESKLEQHLRLRRGHPLGTDSLEGDEIELQEIVRPGGRPTFLPAPAGGEDAMYPADDPVNPKHYNGTACADIGERLSANGYQVLKYCWRLGKKDDPAIELGKALWYLKREWDLLGMRGFLHPKKPRKVEPNLRGLKPEHRQSFLEERIADQSAFTQTIARMLWASYGQQEISMIRREIESQRYCYTVRDQ